MRTRTVPTVPRFRISALRAADIVFVYDQSRGLRDKALRLASVYAQPWLAASREIKSRSRVAGVSPFSHVMLGIDSGLIIHADGKTVNIENVIDALQYATEEAATFEVYRRCDMTVDLADKIASSAIRYYGKKYRFSTFFKNFGSQSAEEEGDTTQFCSRLVAHAYRSAQLLPTELPDNKVLPVDLYQICQSPPWEDVTVEFTEKPLSALEEDAFQKAMASVEVPGETPTAYTELTEGIDNIVQEASRDIKKFREVEFASYNTSLEMYAKLTERANLVLELAKELHREPSAIDDSGAKLINDVLQQVARLLSLAEIPHGASLVTETVLNKIDGSANVARYAGGQTPRVIRALQEGREATKILTYMVLARVGLSCIIARYQESEEFERFQSVKAEYVTSFLEALQNVNNLPEREQAGVNGFLWEEDEEARITYRRYYQIIIVLLKIVELIRGTVGQK